MLYSVNQSIINKYPRLQNRKKCGLHKERSVYIKAGSDSEISMFSVVFEMPLRLLPSEHAWVSRSTFVVPLCHNSDFLYKVSLAVGVITYINFPMTSRAFLLSFCEKISR